MTGHSTELNGAAGDPLSDEVLVAFLDRELPSEDLARIETAAAANPTIRQRLTQLDQAWRMLDFLPETEVDPAFTRTTLEMAAVTTERDKPHPGWSWAGSLLGGLAAAGAAAGVGFGLFAALLPGPNDALLRDLPVIENLDVYQHAESVEFLRQLQSEQLFEEDETEADDVM